MAKFDYPKVALGAWAWGNDGTFGSGIDAAALKPLFDAAMGVGLNLWDTAYAYGAGTSEKVLGRFLQGYSRDSFIVSDKLTPQCMDASATSPVKDMLQTQLSLLNLDRVDIYWVHNAFGAPVWIEELAKHFEGKDDAPVIGVSNHNLEEIKQADETLRAHGLKLGAVQNHYSLINRSSETSGILDWCRDNDVTFFSYMVLEQGALSGKYNVAHPMPKGSARAVVYNPVLGELEVLNAATAKVARKYGVDPALIPIAWAIAKGTLPIVGVTKVSHVEDAAKAAVIELSAEDIAEIEEVASRLHINAIRFWEKEMK